MRLQKGGKSRCSDSVISNMVEPIWAKLSGYIKYDAQRVLAKEFFGSWYSATTF